MALHREAAEAGHEKDIFLANSLLDFYSKCGSMADLFEKMRYRTPVSWHAMIMGCAQNGEEEQALELLSRMKRKGYSPSSRHYVAALKACEGLAALEIGRKLHEEIREVGIESDGVVTSSLIHFYWKSASMVEARQVLEGAASKDIVTWNALISGYAHQGSSKQVFEVFERMKQERVEPNVCTHSGLVEKGKEVFELLCSKYSRSISPVWRHLERGSPLLSSVGMAML